MSLARPARRQGDQSNDMFAESRACVRHALHWYVPNVHAYIFLGHDVVVVLPAWGFCVQLQSNVVEFRCGGFVYGVMAAAYHKKCITDESNSKAHRSF
ncbi:hypothetical protein BRAS3843_940011 [Bradyrhizobium sp. STM 3843]|nr:hypothetical protein BRAS3843_940011 [Bradyrhizobium sp. STM 3843]